MDLAKERLAKTFQRLVDICSEEYERVQGRQMRSRENDQYPEDQSEVFHDALEDGGI